MNKTKMKKYIFLLSLIAIFILSGCADSQQVEECVSGHIYGFFGGFWHGLIAPFDFIGMLIWDDVAVYAPNNNGEWYAFGFVLGSGGFGSLIRAISRNVK